MDLKISEKFSQKICPTCKQVKEASTSHFSRNRKASDGLQSRCKACMSTYRLTHIPGPKPSTVPFGFKVCRKCTLTLPLAQFRDAPKQKSGKHSWCIPCVKHYMKERHAQHYTHKPKQVKEPKVRPIKLKTVPSAEELEKRKMSIRESHRKWYRKMRAKQGKLLRHERPVKHKNCAKCGASCPLVDYKGAKGKRGYLNCPQCRLESEQKRLESLAVYESKISKIEDGQIKCRQCQTRKPASILYFPKSPVSRTGFLAKCKVCVNNSARKGKVLKGRFANKTKRVSDKEGHKFCRRCDLELPINDFRIHSKTDGRITIYHVCKKCEMAQNRENPERYLSIKARQRVRSFLKDREHRYSHSIGCTQKTLKEHIESQFKDGMSWENKGEWHVDHYYPLSKAYRLGEHIFKAACNYKNLRPLWKKENMNKHARIPPEFHDVQKFLDFINL